MEPLIRPEPSEEERRVILAALAEPARPTVYESRWREAALEEGVSGADVDARDDGFLAG